MVTNSTRADSSHTLQLRPAGHARRWIGVQPALLFFTLAALLAATGCHSAPKLPDKNSKTYADVVSAFYVGLAALQVGDDVHAESNLSEVTQLVPSEPAGWANWGILALRQRNYDTAAQRLGRARDLAPQNDRIYDLLGILESQRGEPDAEQFSPPSQNQPTRMGERGIKPAMSRLSNLLDRFSL